MRSRIFIEKDRTEVANPNIEMINIARMVAQRYANSHVAAFCYYTAEINRNEIGNVFFIYPHEWTFRQ